MVDEEEEELEVKEEEMLEEVDLKVDEEMEDRVEGWKEDWERYLIIRGSARPAEPLGGWGAGHNMQKNIHPSLKTFLSHMSQFV